MTVFRSGLFFNSPVTFPSGPILSKGSIRSPIAGTLLHEENTFIPTFKHDFIQPIIDAIALYEGFFGISYEWFELFRPIHSNACSTPIFSR